MTGQRPILPDLGLESPRPMTGQRPILLVAESVSCSPLSSLLKQADQLTLFRAQSRRIDRGGDGQRFLAPSC